MKLSPGHILAGKYRLEYPLAAGGMGSIWVARHLQLDVPVAMKFMEDGREASPAGRARFEREARAAASLRNQHVVQVLDYGVEGEVPYLVMELLQGEDLGQRLSRERRIPLAVASRILAQTARGLRTAHEAGVVHRDLKPANIFLARVDDEETVKILDFGIAKGILSGPLGEATRTGELMGSPHYMSPEQVRSLPDIDPRSDLWSLAVVMFRALTGRLPFGGEQVGNVMAQILADPIPIATQVAPDLPPAVDAFFARGFARDREQRFQSAREMTEAFVALVDTLADLSGSWAAVPATALDQLASLGASRSAPVGPGQPADRQGTPSPGQGWPPGPAQPPPRDARAPVSFGPPPAVLQFGAPPPAPGWPAAPPGSAPPGVAGVGGPTPGSAPPFAPAFHRAPLASLTEVARPIALAGPEASPQAPLAEGASTAAGVTGGPVTHTAFPEARTPPVWWGAATVGGAILGVILGAVAFLLQRSPAPTGPAAGAGVDPVPSATEIAPASARSPAASTSAPASSAASRRR